MKKRNSPKRSLPIKVVLTLCIVFPLGSEVLHVFHLFHPILQNTNLNTPWNFFCFVVC